MDYLIRRDPRELESTGYMEIGPGIYEGVHWQEGFLFVWEDAFAMAEGILGKHFPSYDHFAMNDIPKKVGLRVIEEWQSAAIVIENAATDEASRHLRLEAAYRKNLEPEIAEHRLEISAMLRELAAECAKFYESANFICILGM